MDKKIIFFIIFFLIIGCGGEKTEKLNEEEKNDNIIAMDSNNPSVISNNNANSNENENNSNENNNVNTNDSNENSNNTNNSDLDEDNNNNEENSNENNNNDLKENTIVAMKKVGAYSDGERIGTILSIDYTGMYILVDSGYFFKLLWNGDIGGNVRAIYYFDTSCSGKPYMPNRTFSLYYVFPVRNERLYHAISFEEIKTNNMQAIEEFRNGPICRKRDDSDPKYPDSDFPTPPQKQVYIPVEKIDVLNDGQGLPIKMKYATPIIFIEE